MPAKSKAQQKAAGAALAAKRGKTPKKKLRGAARGMYESMSEPQLEEFASTKRKGKPEHAAHARTKRAGTGRSAAAKRSTGRATRRQTGKSASRRSSKSAGGRSAR